MTDLWYWIFASSVAILSLYNTVLIVSRIIHVSNGRSMLDADAPAGLKLRKWFLITLGVTSAVRLLFTVTEEVFVARFSIQSSAVWILRCIPSILFLLTTSFVTHYLGNLYFSLQGSEGRKFRSIWLIISLIFALTEFVCISILSTVSLESYLHLLQFSFLVLAIHGGLILVVIWYFAISVWRALSPNVQNAQTSKVLVRMGLLVVAVTLSLLTMTLMRADEYELFSEKRELEIKAAGQWFLLFFGESLCSLLMILVITNALTSWETQVRSSWITTTILNHSANSSANNSSSTTTNNNNSTTNNSSTTTNTTKSAIMMMATEQTRILPSTAAVSSSAAAYSAAANKAQYQAIPQQEK